MQGARVAIEADSGRGITMGAPICMFCKDGMPRQLSTVALRTT
jgi:hypothetical protein